MKMCKHANLDLYFLVRKIWPYIGKFATLFEILSVFHYYNIVAKVVITVLVLLVVVARLTTLTSAIP